MPLSPRFPRLDAPRAATVAVVAAFALLVSLRFDEAPVGAMTDDAVYVETARSLAEGRGPVLQVGPDAPAANPGIFPPGFPLLLAPLALARPDSLAALKAVPLLAGLLLLPLCRRLEVPGIAGGPDGEAVVARVVLPALVLLNPWVVGWAGRVLSDLPYTALSLAALLLFESWRRATRPAPGRTLLLALLAGLALLVRSVGLALLLAMALDLAAGRKWRHLLVLAVPLGLTQAVLLLPGWSSGGAFTAAYQAQLLGHSDGPGARAAFVAANAAGYLRELPVALWPWFGAPLRRWGEAQGAGGLLAAAQYGAGAALLGLAAMGWRAQRRDPRTRDRSRLWLLYLGLLTLALLNFDGWPSGVQSRLLLPMMPLLYALVLGGVLALARGRVPGRERRWLAAATALLLLGSLGHNAWRVVRPLRAAAGAGAEAWADPGAGAGWLRVHAGPDAVVMTTDPLARHVHLRLPAIGCGDTLTAPALRRRAARYGAGWLVVGPPGGALPGAADRARTVDTVARTEPGWFPPAWAEPGGSTRIYRLERAVPPAGDSVTR